MRLASNTNYAFIGSNQYYSGTAKYARTGGASYVGFDITTGLTAGDITFMTAPSGTADTSQTQTAVVTMKQGGNVGIGTATPKSKLFVANGEIFVDFSNGGVTNGGGMRLATNSNYAFIGSNQYYSGTGKYARTGGASYVGFDITTGLTAGDITFMTAPSGTADTSLTQTAVVTMKQGGNVGIGTSTPSQKLDVAGNARIGVSGSTNTLMIAGDSSTTGSFIYTDPTQTIISSVPANPLIFKTANIERVRISSNGYVGIGVIPNYKFEVKGDAGTVDTVQRIYGGDAMTAVYRSTLSLLNNPGTTIAAGSGLALTFEPLSNTGGSYVGLSKISGVRENTIANNQDTALTFLTRSGSSNSTIDTEKMRITSTGNVGIGTTSPTAALEISKAVDNNLRFVPSSAASFFIQANSTSATSGQNIILGSRNRDTLFIQNTSGNIGIGTTAPSAALEISKATDNNLRFIPSSATTFFIQANSTSATSGQNMIIGSRNRDTLMIENTTGNIGIGTTAPQAYSGYTTVDIGGTSSTTNGRLQVKKSDGTVKGLFSAESSYAKIGASTNHDFMFFTNDTERMRIKANGNIGVNNSAPTDYGSNYINFEVKGNTPTTGGILSTTVSDFSIINSFFVDSFGGMLGTRTAHPLRIMANNLEKLRVETNGNVGIGTTAPTEKLEVAGYVKATGFKVGGVTMNVPDYVFEPGYKLKTLDEVQASIAEHGHLPGIPSAKEINKDGLDISDMQLKLLEKVEELTLYSIDQHKEIQKLKEENAKLKDKDALLQALMTRIEKLEKK